MTLAICLLSNQAPPVFTHEITLGWTGKTFGTGILGSQIMCHNDFDDPLTFFSVNMR